MCFLRFLSNTLWTKPTALFVQKTFEKCKKNVLQCDKTAAVNSCHISIVRLRGKCFVGLKPPGLCCSFTVQCFIMLRTLFVLIALQLIKASLWIWGSSPMPRQDEALSYVSDNTCHRGFCSVSVNRAQPLPLTFSNHVWSHLSGAWDCDRVGSMADQSSHLLSAICYLPAEPHNTSEVYF